MNLLRTTAWKTPSQTAQRNSFKEVREETGDVRIFAGEKKKSQPSKITANNKKQTSQVNGFKCFSLYGKMQESGLTEISPLIFIITI